MARRKKIEKSFAKFMKDETGKMGRDSILKIGLGTITGLGAMSVLSPDVSAGHTNTTDTYTDLKQTSGGSDYDDYSTHTHNDHYNHSSY